MAYYAQFYYRFVRADGTAYYEEGVGDRQIIRLDGRMHFANMHYVAADQCAKRGFDGYRIGRGQIGRLTWLGRAITRVSNHETPAPLNEPKPGAHSWIVEAPTNVYRTDAPNPFDGADLLACEKFTPGHDLIGTTRTHTDLARRETLTP